MPAYAGDGKGIVFVQAAMKYGSRQATLGFSDQARRDAGGRRMRAARGPLKRPKDPGPGHHPPSVGACEESRPMTFAVRPIARAALPAGVLLAVPLVAMRFTDDVAWSPFDFVFMGALLFGTFLTFDAAARRLASRAQRAAVAFALATAFLLVWVNASVGIVGAPGGPNVLYLGVLAVGPQRFSAPPGAGGDRKSTRLNSSHT